MDPYNQYEHRSHYLANTHIPPSSFPPVKKEQISSHRYEPYLKLPTNLYPSPTTSEKSPKMEVRINEPSFYRDYCNKRHDYQSPEIDSQLQTAIQAILTEFESKKITTSMETSTTAKRKRASNEQLRILKQVFEYTFFPSTELRNELARVLEMTPRAVQVWFQNKRQSWKSSKGKTPNGKSTSPRLSPPGASTPPIITEVHTSSSAPSKLLPINQTYSDRPYQATVDNLPAHPRVQHSSPRIVDSARESYFEPLAPFRTFSVESQSHAQISERRTPPLGQYGRVDKLPSLLEMGINSPSNVPNSLPHDTFSRNTSIVNNLRFPYTVERNQFTQHSTHYPDFSDI